eukprot:Phypoly_transcript_13926.p1 GENE.Phypoly_transcript_13926~~Phypoly_transcript_13926.p1  ORF type:complete len:315 (+),score=16.23 Phypoly_transcript_13926:77-946(+)
MNIQSVDWPIYICESMPAMSQEARDFMNMQLSVEDFFNGCHVSLPIHLMQLGDAISGIFSHESGTDVLMHLLLTSCNPYRATLMLLDHGKPIEVWVGSRKFASIPNGLVVERKNVKSQNHICMIVCEDKNLGAMQGEFQIPGEMLAAAYYNFRFVARISQTIVAIRAMQASLTFYRADFSAQYLASVESDAACCERTTIFRVGGSDSKFAQGLSIGTYGEKRNLALTILGSVFAMSHEIITDLHGNGYQKEVWIYNADLCHESSPQKRLSLRCWANRGIYGADRLALSH